MNFNKHRHAYVSMDVFSLPITTINRYIGMEIILVEIILRIYYTSHISMNRVDHISI